MRRLTAVSGFGAKGPAAFLLEIEGRRMLLDLGTGPDHGRRPDISGIGRADAILISHGHPDHVGSLDLGRELGDPPVHASEPVRMLAADAALREARILPRSGVTRIAGVDVETGGAGHAPGAVWMRIGGEDGLLYTGDLSDESILYAYDRPPQARGLVFDASYGSYDEPLAEGFALLLEAARGRPLLLPVPAGGRGLEMAILFHEAGEAVALCPAHRAVGERLLGLEEWLAPQGRTRLAAMLKHALALSGDSPPRGVMIAAGANAEAGLAAELVQRFAGSKGVGIVFTGHLAQGTPGHSLTQAGQARFLRWNVHPRLSAIRDLLHETRPTVAMPAFVDAPSIAAVAAACPDFAFADLARMEW